MALFKGFQLFLEYAEPCAEYRLNAGLISQQDYRHLKFLIQKEIPPNVSFLQKCFPSAVDNYRKFCKETGIGANFSFGSVANYWRNHHKGDTPVDKATILEIKENGATVICGSKTLNVLNPHEHPLEAMLTVVTVHRGVIIEVLE